MPGQARSENTTPLFIAIDVGSQSIKGAIIDGQGQVVACENRPYPAKIITEAQNGTLSANWFYQQLLFTLDKLLN